MVINLNLSKAFVALLNLGLKAQPNINIESLEGRSFAIAIDELPQDIAIRIENATISAVEEQDIPQVDVTISGSLKAIIAMIQNSDDGLESDDLYIIGKISTAKLFQQFLASFSLDFQSFFAQFMSEENASKTATFVEQGLHVAKGGIERVGMCIKEYVEKKQLVVNNTELSAMRDEIMQLHQRIDALSSLLARNEGR